MERQCEGSRGGSQCIKNKRGTRHARSDAYDVARGENTPQYIIACQGAAVKGEYTPGGYLVAGEDRVGRVVWGTRGEISANEQKRAKASKGKCEAREGASRSKSRDARHARGNGLKKLIRTNPHRAQKRV